MPLDDGTLRRGKLERSSALADFDVRRRLPETNDHFLLSMSFFVEHHAIIQEVAGTKSTSTHKSALLAELAAAIEDCVSSCSLISYSINMCLFAYMHVTHVDSGYEQIFTPTASRFQCDQLKAQISIIQNAYVMIGKIPHTSKACNCTCLGTWSLLEGRRARLCKVLSVHGVQPHVLWSKETICGHPFMKVNWPMQNHMNRSWGI